jgi:hypothetical protein
MSRESGAEDPAADGSVARAIELAERVRAAEGLLSDIRERRDQAIRDAIASGGVTTRELGRRCGLTASQVSAIWRREHPPRPRRVGRP